MIEGIAMTYHGIEFDPHVIAEFCQRHGITKFSLFGSILRNDFRDDSDIDVFVEFPLGKTPGLDLGGMQQELTQMFGREVDLKTAGFISHYFRNEVLAEARVQYYAA
jgi:predicted nucleotidyltransferase